MIKKLFGFSLFMISSLTMTATAEAWPSRFFGKLKSQYESSVPVLGNECSVLIWRDARHPGVLRVRHYYSIYPSNYRTPQRALESFVSANRGRPSVYEWRAPNETSSRFVDQRPHWLRLHLNTQGIPTLLEMFNAVAEQEKRNHPDILEAYFPVDARITRCGDLRSVNLEEWDRRHNW